MKALSDSANVQDDYFLRKKAFLNICLVFMIAQLLIQYDSLFVNSSFPTNMFLNVSSERF